VWASYEWITDKERIDMARTVSASDLIELSVAERIQLVGDLWDSIAAVPKALPLTDAHSISWRRYRFPVRNAG